MFERAKNLTKQLVIRALVGLLLLGFPPTVSASERDVDSIRREAMLSKPSVQRRCDLDWLRVLLILMVLVFQSVRFFDLEGWNVKSATTYLSAQVAAAFPAFRVTRAVRGSQ